MSIQELKPSDQPVAGSMPIKAIELACYLAAYPLDGYTVFEKQYNAGVDVQAASSER
jgi:hypothetical protein